MEKLKVLILVLSSVAWEATGKPDKMFELRNYSKWIESRLFNKDGSSREYDEVHLINTYKKNAEVKRFEFIRTCTLKECVTWNFSGLKYTTNPGDYMIELNYLP